MIQRIFRFIPITPFFLFALSPTGLHAQEIYTERSFKLADDLLLQKRFAEAIVFYERVLFLLMRDYPIEAARNMILDLFMMIWGMPIYKLELSIIPKSSRSLF